MAQGRTGQGKVSVEHQKSTSTDVLVQSTRDDDIISQTASGGASGSGTCFTTEETDAFTAAAACSACSSSASAADTVSASITAASAEASIGKVPKLNAQQKLAALRARIQRRESMVKHVDALDGDVGNLGLGVPPLDNPPIAESAARRSCSSDTRSSVQSSEVRLESPLRGGGPRVNLGGLHQLTSSKAVIGPLMLPALIKLCKALELRYCCQPPTRLVRRRQQCRRDGGFVENRARRDGSKTHPQAILMARQPKWLHLQAPA